MDEPQPVTYIVGVDDADLRMPVRFMRMSDGAIYRLKHHLVHNGNEIVEPVTREGNSLRGVESGITYRYLAERPYVDPAVMKEAWDASPPPWRGNTK